MRIDLLEPFRLDPKVIAIMKEKYGAELLPIQERAFKEYQIHNGGSFLISAVTSSGKTLMGEILALYYGSKDKRVFYLVPTNMQSVCQREGAEHRRTANVDGSRAPRFRHPIRLRPTGSATPYSGERSHPPGTNPGERFCQVKLNKINKMAEVHGNRTHPGRF